jgi:tRNA pseudouridine13 synthase
VRIKCRPEDFLVRERNRLADPANLNSAAGEYGVYRLTKRALTTPDAIGLAARRLGLPKGAFRYGGLKDRWGVTEQTVTVRSQRDCSASWQDMSLLRLGWAGRHVGPGDILANEFEVTVRDLPPDWQPGEPYGAGAGALMVNYFDDQRFGSIREGGQFAGEALVRREWARALYLLVAAAGPSDLPGDAAMRRRLATAWGDWEACRQIAPPGARRRIFQLLSREPGGFRGAVNLLGQEELSHHLGAWQSQIYNQMVRLALRRALGSDLRVVAGAAGDYLFPAIDGTAAHASLAGLELPTMGRGARWPDARGEELGRAVLEPLGLRPQDFVVRGLARYQLRSHVRPAWVKPAGLEALGPARPDQLHAGRLAVTLCFGLPPGSYATILIKQMFGGPSGPASEPGRQDQP